MTLIEILVAISIFSLVIVVTLLTFTIAAGYQRKLRNMREVGNAARLTLEKISRAVEYADREEGGYYGYRIINPEKLEIYYRGDNQDCTRTYSYKADEEISPTLKIGRIAFSDSCASDPGEQMVTSENVDVRDLTFSEEGGEPTRANLGRGELAEPPLLKVRIRAESSKFNRRGSKAEIELETEVTLHNLIYLADI